MAERKASANLRRQSVNHCPALHMVIVAFLITVVLMACVSCADSGGKFATAYDEYMQRADEVWLFRGAVLVAKGDSVLFSKAYGPARIAEDRLNTVETKFLIGSATKSFTAITVMQLVEQGLVDLNAPISSYLPDYPKPTADKVTVHHLLSHTSGIPDLVGVPEYYEDMDKPITPEQIVGYLKEFPLDFEPGERYAYSSSNYVLLGMILETVTGQSWEEYVHEHICVPAGMTSTGVFDDYSEREDFAVGYTPHETGSLIEAPVVHPSRGYAAGGLASTVGDMYLLHRALYDTVLLKPSSIKAMLANYSGSYGYGWLVDDFGGHRFTGHGGGLPGYIAMYQRWIDDSLCVVVLSNSWIVRAHTIASGLAAIAMGEFYELPVIKQPESIPPAKLSEYVGTYRVNPVTTREIKLVSGKLMTQRTGGSPSLILPEGNDRFFIALDQMVTLTFLRDDNGVVIGHVLNQAFNSDTAMLVR